MKEDTDSGYRYDPTEGRLYRLVEVIIPSRRGDDGFFINGKPYPGGKKSATHIIWKIMTGSFPPKGMYIDHIDGDVCNNEWSNLRLATPSQNQYNRAKLPRWNHANEDMEIGVQKVGMKYKVQLTNVYYGTFVTLEEANEHARKVHAQKSQGFRRL